jgi:hypothetical protein
MRVISTVCGVVLVSALSGGCLRKEVAHTVYVTPAGVVWSVVEREVRSDARAPEERIQEEHAYVLAAAAGKHPVAEALRRLGAASVTTTWLRRERPYTVMTEARFADVRQLALAILRDAQARGDVSVIQEGCETRFGVRVEIDSTPDSAGDTAADELLTDLAAYRFVVTEGRFTSADGFTILDEGTVAVPDAQKTAADGILTLALTWAGEGCVTKR